MTAEELQALLARRVLEVDCSIPTRSGPTSWEAIARSHEALRFGDCPDGLLVVVPIISVDALSANGAVSLALKKKGRR